jgi:lipid-A-disaccharide synthase
MRIFLSAGEPSGDIHGANLIRHLRQRDPNTECVGFGGDQMQAAGCRLLYPLCGLAVMGIVRVLTNAHSFLTLLSRADRFFRHQRPDAVVLIDYPGFNWWLARRAQFHGIPVFYFIPPQLWSWGSRRIKKMQRWVDHVLCTLPFEKAWFEARGVHAEYVGHPFFDELPNQHLDAAFMDPQRSRAGDIVGVLPGSRTQELERNLASQIRAARLIHQACPQTRFLVACYRQAHQRMVGECLRHSADLPIETHVGRTPEIIELSRACLSVSGSVSLELLYRRKPSVIVYRLNRFERAVARRLLTTKFICLVNLLADQELYPEFLTDHCPAEGAATRILTWLDDAAARAALVGELDALCSRAAIPGACARTAEFILKTLAQSVHPRAAG